MKYRIVTFNRPVLNDERWEMETEYPNFGYFHKWINIETHAYGIIEIEETGLIEVVYHTNIKFTNHHKTISQ
jgi:hypothetical protein